DPVTQRDGRGCRRGGVPSHGRRPALVEDRGLIARRDRVSPSRTRRGFPHYVPSAADAQAISFSSSSPGNSLTEGYFMISFRAIFQAFWTIHERDRSCRVASSWISFSISSGK